MPNVPHSGEALLSAGILPIAPGPYVAAYVLPRNGDTPAAAAEKMGLDVSELDAVLHDKQPITERVARCLATYTAQPFQYWLSLQAAWDYAQSSLHPREMRKLMSVSPTPPIPVPPPASFTPSNKGD